ncbi:POT family domain-containing protein [Ditylenchus destructor]|uniref:POT family domain-containing protein n=1 Tax=Ditylenchus destructor TaxID=166010 RepID=A0AAD4R5E3_9BILA|nr:POT family domain-containing protein [Ditylenchus destructor]
MSVSSRTRSGFTGSDLNGSHFGLQNGDQKGRVRKRKPKPPMATTWPEMLKAWPMCTVLIVANEFFQKFSALNTVLPMYLLNGLKFTSNQTTIFFNINQILSGFLPLFGSIMADGYIGKYKTILYSCVLYGIGKIIMAGASVMNSQSVIHPWLDIVGVLIISIGMGGIIPCVASFGGDQFEPHQERMISVFFSIFYASINSGALISTFVLPILRSQPCLDQDSCYPLSFGVSACLMIFSSFLFVAGSRWYKKQPPKGNVFGDVFRTVRTALSNRSKVASKTRNHWLDYYFDTHNCMHDEKCIRLQMRKNDSSQCAKKQFVEDIKSLLRVLVMYLPIPVFWALYDQQYTVWLVQAIQMDCRIWGDYLFLPDQMQFINPVLILVFIALFESVIYPLCSYFVKLTPLRKMVAGGVVASIAFVVSAAVQVKVNATLPELPDPSRAFVGVMNTFDDCTVNITWLEKDGSLPRFTMQIPGNTSLENNKLLERRELFDVEAGNATWAIRYNGSECENNGLDLPTRITYEVESEAIYYIYIGKMGAFIAKADPKKPTGGTGEFSISVNLALSDVTYKGNLVLCRNNTEGTTAEHPCDPQRPEDFYYYEMSYDDGKSSDLVGYVNYSRESVGEYAEKKGTIYAFKPVRPGNWNLFYMENTPRSIGQKTMSKEQVKVAPTGINFHMQAQGGVYVLLLTGTKDKPEKRIFQVVPDNTVTILWQIPQIAIITAAEILFSIPGYEFSYSQSGTSMKSVVQALWFFTTAVGDFMIILLALFNMKDLAMQNLICAGAMLVVIFIFALMSVYYYEKMKNGPLGIDCI